VCGVSLRLARCSQGCTSNNRLAAAKSITGGRVGRRGRNGGKRKKKGINKMVHRMCVLCGLSSVSSVCLHVSMGLVQSLFFLT